MLIGALGGYTPQAGGLAAAMAPAAQVAPGAAPAAQIGKFFQGDATAGGYVPYPEADTAAQANGARLAEERATANVMNDRFAKECQTCKDRRYVDGSDDPGVSFQTPQNVAPGLSASAVASHEQEHVTREQAKASREGRQVVSQSVVLHGAICPECGRYYIAGGTTRTTTRGGEQKAPAHQNEEAVGKLLNATA